MPYFALTDVDWPYDDRDEGRAIVVSAFTPEEAVKLATEILLEEHGTNLEGLAGGVTWKVAQLMNIGFKDVEWEDGKPNFSGEFVNYSDGVNGPLIMGGSAPQETP